MSPCHGKSFFFILTFEALYPLNILLHYVHISIKVCATIRIPINFKKKQLHYFVVIVFAMPRF